MTMTTSPEEVAEAEEEVEVEVGEPASNVEKRVTCPESARMAVGGAVEAVGEAEAL